MTSEGGSAVQPPTEGGEATPGPAPKRPRTTAPRKGHPLDIFFGPIKIKGKLDERCAVVRTGGLTDYLNAYFFRTSQDEAWQRAYTLKELERFLDGKGDILEDRVVVTKTAEIKAALHKLLEQSVIDDKSLATIQAMVPQFKDDPVVTRLKDALEEGRKAQATLEAMRRELRDLVKCPITLGPLVDAVICMRCGRNVSEGALFDALRNTTDPCCPLCRAPTRLSLRDCSCGSNTQNLHGHSDECRDGMVMATIQGGSFAPNRLAREVIEMLPSQEREPDPEQSPTLL